jgi:hypothetical protein
MTRRSFREGWIARKGVYMSKLLSARKLRIQGCYVIYRNCCCKEYLLESKTLTQLLTALWFLGWVTSSAPVIATRIKTKIICSLIATNSSNSRIRKRAGNKDKGKIIFNSIGFSKPFLNNELIGPWGSWLCPWMFNDSVIGLSVTPT